jgi:hypothetical protein
MSNIQASLFKAKQEMVVAWLEIKTKNPDSEAIEQCRTIIDGIEKLQIDLQVGESQKIAKDEAWQAEFDALIAGGERTKMQATKMYRAKHGTDLRESLYAVEKLLIERNK